MSRVDGGLTISRLVRVKIEVRPSTDDMKKVVERMKTLGLPVLLTALGAVVEQCSVCTRLVPLGDDAVDARVVDGVVNGAARTTVMTSFISNLADMNLVDGAVNLVGFLLETLSGIFRRLQTGLVQNYALIMLVGIFVLVAVLYAWN